MEKKKVSYGHLTFEAKEKLSQMRATQMDTATKPMKSGASWRVKCAYFCFVFVLIAMIGSLIMGLCAASGTKTVVEYDWRGEASYRQVRSSDPMAGVHFMNAAACFGGAFFILFVAALTLRLEHIAKKRRDLKPQTDAYAVFCHIAMAVMVIAAILEWATVGGGIGFFTFLVYLLFTPIPLCLAEVANIVKMLYAEESGSSAASASGQDAPRPKDTPILKSLLDIAADKEN